MIHFFVSFQIYNINLGQHSSFYCFFKRRKCQKIYENPYLAIFANKFFFFTIELINSNDYYKGFNIVPNTKLSYTYIRVS